MIETKNSVTEWDDTLWVIFLDSAIVNTDGTIEFCFKDGSKIPVYKPSNQWQTASPEFGEVILCLN